MSERKKSEGFSGAAGLSGGTGFAGLVLLMHESPFRSALLIFAPAITVGTSKCWNVLTLELDSLLADWRINSSLRKATKLYKRLIAAHPADCELVQKAKRNMEALNLLRMENMQKRVSTILTN